MNSFALLAELLYKINPHEKATATELTLATSFLRRLRLLPVVEIRLPTYGAKMPNGGAFRTQHEVVRIAYA